MVDYVPLRMNPNSQRSLLPPVHADYLERVDLIMQDLGEDEGLANCNPRSPYLLLAWLLVGWDNEYRTCQYLDEMRITKQVVSIHIRIALGDTPLHDGIWDIVGVVRDIRANRTARDVTWIAWSATWSVARAALTTWAGNWSISSAALTRQTSWVAGGTAGAAKAAAKAAEDAAMTFGVVDDAARVAISTKARQWAHISDEEALQIARQLTLDIFSH
jgi:hypothetical protein